MEFSIRARALVLFIISHPSETEGKPSYIQYVLATVFQTRRAHCIIPRQPRKPVEQRCHHRQLHHPDAATTNSRQHPASGKIFFAAHASVDLKWKICPKLYYKYNRGRARACVRFGYVASRRVLSLCHVVLLYMVADVEKLVGPIVNYCLLHLVKLQALIKMSKTQPRVLPLSSPSTSSLSF